MQTYLIVSQNQEFIKQQIASINSKISVSTYNSHLFSPSPSIGIGEVRNIKAILTKKTFAGGDRLIIINSLEKATSEAANALLKILEEPPNQTYIILTTNNLNRIPPTVISRCQIISDRKSTLKQPDMDFNEEMKLLKQILTSSPGERIILSQTLGKSKEDAVKTLDSLILLLRQLLYEEKRDLKLSVKGIAVLINKTIAAKSYIERNINYKATLDILLLGFPKL